jgi:hypothetical protein
MMTYTEPQEVEEQNFFLRVDSEKGGYVDKYGSVSKDTEPAVFTLHSDNTLTTSEGTICFTRYDGEKTMMFQANGIQELCTMKEKFSIRENGQLRWEDQAKAVDAKFCLLDLYGNAESYIVFATFLKPQLPSRCNAGKVTLVIERLSEERAASASDKISSGHDLTTQHAAMTQRHSFYLSVADEVGEPNFLNAKGFVVSKDQRSIFTLREDSSLETDEGVVCLPAWIYGDTTYFGSVPNQELCRLATGFSITEDKVLKWVDTETQQETRFCVHSNYRDATVTILATWELPDMPNSCSSGALDLTAVEVEEESQDIYESKKFSLYIDTGSGDHVFIDDNSEAGPDVRAATFTLQEPGGFLTSSTGFVCLTRRGQEATTLEATLDPNNCLKADGFFITDDLYLRWGDHRTGREAIFCSSSYGNGDPNAAALVLAVWRLDLLYQFCNSGPLKLGVTSVPVEREL